MAEFEVVQLLVMLCNLLIHTQVSRSIVRKIVDTTTK